LNHLTENQIDRFLTSPLNSIERQRAARHLLAGCGICSRKLVERASGRLLDEAQESRRRRASRNPLRDHTVAAALKQDYRWRLDQKKLDRSLELLGTHPEGYDGLTFRQIQDLHGEPLMEALLRRSWESRFRDPGATRWLAYNALKVAESLRPAEHAPASIFDLQARAWFMLANAYKANEELAEAEAAFARARDLLRQGSGDLRLLALAAQLEASFRGAQSRLFEARELLDRTHGVYLKLGDRHGAGQALITKGTLLGSEASSPSAVSLFRQGLVLLDPDRDPQFAAAGQQGLISALITCGEYREASRLFLESDLRRRLNDTPNVRWVEGQLLAGLGKLAKAEHALISARDELLGRGRANAAAHLGLTLLPVLAGQNKHREARQVASEAYGVLRDIGHAFCAAKAKHYLR
jgi:tetratricopeptide (TPR) repeat protein